jgi:hypothetical protein
MVPISLAAALSLMYFYISTFRSMCAVLNIAVFCSSLTAWFPGMVLKYFLNDFETGFCRSYYYWYHPRFYIPHTLYFYCIIIIIIIIISCCAAQRGLWPPRSRGFLITHNDAPQSVVLLWTSDQLVAETST